MNYPHPIIAREGWPILGGALLISIVIHIFLGIVWAWPFWLFAVFTVQFFRDPARTIPQQSGVILSPADGRVVAVQRAHDPYVGREALKISIFMNVFNVHSNRIPIDGRVVRLSYFPGKFFNADLDKASMQNERNAMELLTSTGETVTVVQIAGLLARRILCYAKEGQAVQRGQRYGFIRFGSRVDLYLPLNAEPLVSIGEKIYATQSIVAKL